MRPDARGRWKFRGPPKSAGARGRQRSLRAPARALPPRCGCLSHRRQRLQSWRCAQRPRRLLSLPRPSQADPSSIRRCSLRSRARRCCRSPNGQSSPVPVPRLRPPWRPVGSDRSLERTHRGNPGRQRSRHPDPTRSPSPLHRGRPLLDRSQHDDRRVTQSPEVLPPWRIRRTRRHRFDGLERLRH